MLHVYVTSVEDKKEMKSYQSLFLREFLKFKRGVPNLSHAMLIAENRRNLRWTVAFLYQWLRLMQAIKHKPHVTQMIRFVLHILGCARCFVWGCPRWDRLLVFSRCDFKMFQLQVKLPVGNRLAGAYQISELRALGLNNHRLAFGSYSTNF